MAAAGLSVSGALRMLRRHGWTMVAAFALSLGVSAAVWVLRPAARDTSNPPPKATAIEGPRTVDVLTMVGAIFEGELAAVRRQISENEAALAALDDKAAGSDLATRATLAAAARRQVTLLDSAIARDRAALAAPQAPVVVEARPSQKADPEVVAANQAVDDAQARLAELEGRLTPQHPDVVRQRTVLRERQTTALATVAASNAAAVVPPPAISPAERTREISALQERIAMNEAARARAIARSVALAQGDSMAGAVNEERERLTRELETNRAVQAALESKKREVSQKLAAAETAAETAAATAAATRPRTEPVAVESRALSVPWLALGLGSSMLFALLVGVVLETRDTRIHDATDLQTATTAPLLVSISEIVPLAKAPKALDRDVSALPEPASATLIWHPRCPRRTIEQYRRLAQSLRRLRADRQIRVVGVTSALPGEGKTLSAVNLAVSLAESYRQRVVIVDADLRRPAVSRLLSLPAQDGLADWLRRDDERECPSVRLTSRLSVIPAGTPNNDPTPLLTSLRMALLVATLRADFDWVVVDTPPTGLIADAGALEGNLDGFVVLAAADRTDAQVLKQTLASLGPSRVLGVVLNRVRRSEGVDHDDYSSYYGSPTK